MKRENSNALFAAANVVFTAIFTLTVFAVFGFKIFGYAGLEEPAWLVMLLGAMFMASLLAGISMSAITTLSYRLVKGVLSLMFKTRFKIFNKIAITIPALFCGLIVLALLIAGIGLLFILF